MTGIEGEVGVEGQGEAVAGSEDDRHEIVADPGESEGEREEVESGHQTEHSDSEEKEEYGQRIVASRRTAAVQSESDGSDKIAYVDQDDEEVDQVGRYCCFTMASCYRYFSYAYMRWLLPSQITTS